MKAIYYSTWLKRNAQFMAASISFNSSLIVLP